MSAPQEIGPYRVVRPLGQGGMGAVYLARDPRLNREVALKVFSGAEARTEYARHQLLNEARAAASFNHPHIASVHDVLDVDGQVAIVFEYVEGETLAERLKRGPLDTETSIRLARQLADALAAAHQHGIVHRDLKPANIVITADGIVKVLDFGVARVMPDGADQASSARTTAAGFVGTIGYAAPEQCLGQSVDARADVFALGVVLYEMLTGRRPFGGGDATEVVRAMLNGDIPPLKSRASGAPLQLHALITSMLAADPSTRPASMREVSDVLSSFVRTEFDFATRPLPRRRAVAMSWVVIAVLTAALVATIALGRRDRAADDGKPPVVAVLPLTNASDDPANAHVAVGVADSLVNRLAGIPSVTVLSRAAVAGAVREARNVAEITSELGATYVVDGTVQQIDQTLRISLNLVRADTSVAWADTVEGPFRSVFELQARLASALAQALSVQLSAADRAHLAQQPTMNPQALSAYWRGRALMDRRDIRGNLEAALRAFDEAIGLDPNYADAYAAKAETLWAQYQDTREPVAAKAAADAANTALRLNPDSAQVRYVLAVTLAGTGDLAGAAEELQRALALRPNFDEARRELGAVLARQGKLDEAIAELRKAIALRPNFWGHYSALGLRLYEGARYDEAVEAFKHVIALQPDNFMGYQQLGTVYQVQGKVDEALEQYQHATTIRPSSGAYSNIGTLHYQRGEYALAAEAYRSAIKLRRNAANHGNLGDALRRLGQTAQARAAYREAIRLANDEVKVNPKDPQAVAMVALYTAKAGEYDAARAQLRSVERLGSTDVNVLVTVASVYALVDEPDRALPLLERAVAQGYRPSVIAQMDEFATLRNSKRFQMLVSEASGRSP